MDPILKTPVTGGTPGTAHHLAPDINALPFVDDLFLGARRVIETMMAAFTTDRVGDWVVWDATGRINVLDRASDDTLNTLARNGSREVALGIESGSERMLELIDKRILSPGDRTATSRSSPS